MMESSGNTERTVAIVGAGTMGAGIAQLAAQHGWRVLLKDVDGPTVQKAISGIRKRLDRLVEKERITQAQADAAGGRIEIALGPEALAEASLVIEAIVEDLKIKASVLSEIVPGLTGDCIIATNTSSLSVSELGDAIDEPKRTVGMHFFNPAPLMKLVEVIAGRETDASVVERVSEVARAWGKEVALSSDQPGFIVNHVARPYYLEAFRILEDGLATPKQIDHAMTELGGFRMGPLSLTDLIGQDVNTKTTRSVWEQLDQPPLLHPSRLQEQLVADGHLGRKTGQGVYRYADGGAEPALHVEPKPMEIPSELQEAVTSFCHKALDTHGDDRQHYVFARILVAVIAQAVLAKRRGVATEGDIDTALRFGVNYPKGPFTWAEEIGWPLVQTLLQRLNETVEDDRFRLPEDALSAG